MDNSAIADNFSLLSKLMDIHGENSFKSKTYSIAAFNIEKLPSQLKATPKEKIAGLKGIGESTAKKIIEMLDGGELKSLTEYLQKTPPGVVEMLNIKGIGPKKIHTIWKEMGIESIGELLYACNENRLTLFKGFGEKTQKNVSDSINFYLQNQGVYLYAQIEEYAKKIEEKLQKAFPPDKTLLAGAFRRQMETIEIVEYCTSIEPTALKKWMLENEFLAEEETANFLLFKGPENVVLKFYPSSKNNFFYHLFINSCNNDFLGEWNAIFKTDEKGNFENEEAIFKVAGIPYIIPALRETSEIIRKAQKKQLPDIILPTDVCALIHSHSNWSDGVNTIEEMATELIKRNYEYLVLSDHSKAAAYANGLTEERIKEQHPYIDELNKKLHPFKIFKSIECDILNDGSMDYSNQILSTFDLVIASVHSNLKMTEEKAMMRLLGAIENPYVTILGHMTGRLLLSRNGYPVDHKKIIETCIKNDVVIELNAHPRRLDIDWRWIDYAVEKGALISIDPDAHALEGFDDIKYGVLVAQKAGLTKEKNLSSFSLKQFEHLLTERKKKRKIS
jgi:DNA polymerase (family 10)